LTRLNHACDWKASETRIAPRENGRLVPVRELERWPEANAARVLE
jgi:hypothetical protein